jgi:hypothetical protein
MPEMSLNRRQQPANNASGIVNQTDLELVLHRFGQALVCVLRMN